MSEVQQVTKDWRIEKDSLGEIRVPADALWGAQTQRGIENFQISGRGISPSIIHALGAIKESCALVNGELGQLDADLVEAVAAAAVSVRRGEQDEQFPIDVFQTGSGTSSNMNTNEVIAALATERLGRSVHPNDHVNFGQSSNDVFPSAIRVAAVVIAMEELLPALDAMTETLEARAEELGEVVKTGRTHLMDAMPVRFDQVLLTWRDQLDRAGDGLKGALDRLRRLPIGGTAVGTGVNAPDRFGEYVAGRLTEITGVPFEAMERPFEGMAAQDAIVEMSGQLKVLAVVLMKVANDLRWMNSGPLAGLGEIELPALQPGSSIMPGKINPVIPEAVAMVAAQVIGNDVSVTVAGQSGSFELNVMLPLLGEKLIESESLMARAMTSLTQKALAGFTVRRDRVESVLRQNPILVTALNRVIGYERGATIAKRAYIEGRAIIEVAREMTDLSDEELNRLLDPGRLT